MSLFQFSSVSWGPTIGTKFTIACENGPLQVKWWCHMFSSMKKKKCMESELSDIFRVDWSPKIYCLGPWRPNAKLFLQCDISFWRNIQIFRIKVLHLSVFLVKQYTSLIYVKQKSFCLVNWAYSFVGPRGPISCSKIAKIFHAYEG